MTTISIGFSTIQDHNFKFFFLSIKSTRVHRHVIGSCWGRMGGGGLPRGGCGQVRAGCSMTTTMTTQLQRRPPVATCFRASVWRTQNDPYFLLDMHKSTSVHLRCISVVEHTLFKVDKLPKAFFISCAMPCRAAHQAMLQGSWAFAKKCVLGCHTWGSSLHSGREWPWGVGVTQKGDIVLTVRVMHVLMYTRYSVEIVHRHLSSFEKQVSQSLLNQRILETKYSSKKVLTHLPFHHWDCGTEWCWI